MECVYIVELTYELLRRLIGPDNTLEDILVFIASVLLWRILKLLLSSETHTKPEPQLQKSTISSVHQTDYPEKHNSARDEGDSTGCLDGLINQIVIPFLLVVIVVLVACLIDVV